jgi:hypothetical protein
MKRPTNVLLLVLVVVCLLSWWWQRSSRSPDEQGVDQASSSPVSTTLGQDEDPDWSLPAAANAVQLVVLNGTSRSGLARDVSLSLTADGCVVQRVGNASRDDFERTILVNRRLPKDEAAELARRLGEVMLTEERDERAPEDALLVLGEDWSRVVSALEKRAAAGNAAAN